MTWPPPPEQQQPAGAPVPGPPGGAWPPASEPPTTPWPSAGQPGGYPPPPPGYGAYPTQTPPPHPRAGKFNVLAIVGFVLSLCGGLLGLVLSIVSLNQIKKTGERGRGLAIAGVTLSSLWLLVLAGIVAAAVIQAGPGADRDPQGQITDPGEVAVDELRVGDCIPSIPEGDEFADLDAVPCSTPHLAEVYANVTMPDGPYPGEDEIFDFADTECLSALEDYSEFAYASESVQIFYLYPLERFWPDDRQITCIAIEEEERTGSLRGLPAP